ncbi:hypothetical protein JCM10512_1432 [Bacteroides reticulotermitis JCM 10512]|uniref:DUF1735 domain-containing protein n=2 Tax=Bacteroides reticulotermitis TaxID=1133319 RepID=W4UQT2_9BACE|nr:hypothetical protein JCM10512_1432 [Bacteroides reticulotermitis JCM 10512]
MVILKVEDMKKLINTAFLFLLIIGGSACQDELDNELFQKYSYLNKNGWKECEVKIKEDNTGILLLDFGINGSSENGKNVVITITNDPDTLEGYNFDRYKFQYDSYYPELPTSCYTFDQEAYIIPAGQLKTTASIRIDLNQIQDIYNDYVLPIKISSSIGEPIGPDKYSKLLANIKFTNKFSGVYSGNGKLTIEETGQNTATGSAKLYAISQNACFMYAGNATSETDPANYKKYILNVSFSDNEKITITDPVGKLDLETMKATIAREYKYHNTDTRYYIETSVLDLKYKYRNQSERDHRMLIFEGKHTLTRNVLRSEYPNVIVKEE